jgi:hypothetical protein
MYFGFNFANSRCLQNFDAYIYTFFHLCSLDLAISAGTFEATIDTPSQL